MITKDELKQIVLNSRIAFSEAEIVELTQKINETLEMISLINEVDLADVQPMYYPNEHEADFRNPELELVTERTTLLANTMTSEDGYFKVPAVLKDGEA